MTSKRTKKLPAPKPTAAHAKDVATTTPSAPKDAAPATAKTLDAQIEAVKAMDLEGLRTEYARVFGTPTAAKDKDALVARITERLALGGKGAPAKRSPGRPISRPPTATAPAAKTEKAPSRSAPAASPFTQDPRLPAPGSTISVTHKGKTYETEFLGADGFDYRGERFRSLSSIASKILGGVAVNGFLWWGLIKPAARPTKPAAEKKPAKARAARKTARKGKAK